ncbi:toll/interleukin-1 receptor domain-containing protein [Sphingomonas glaciei]|uniref:Toll/interleukin-1 receptor domain-containing protein n=1 Tax=Sphingomonas glaciei TaxID=2938948 RepID=A0ABY5MXM6_9SPHN|nr:toll/interleukin-1 receptor domain-containing protein [Sphingomonas glaciei]UUR08239.1 toll/interleukin-1 receptor domain-containing protein [Sphingomonas glaciei]
MRATERMDLLEKIGTELQRRYTFSEIDVFLRALDISTMHFDYGSSKRIYVKQVLGDVSEKDLLHVADELGLFNASAGNSGVSEPPANWKDTKDFRLFISHLSADKLIATRLKDALSLYDIAGFVAHEDIQPTLAWQDEIERALQTMDAMVAVHTPGFSKSYWTQQEVGFALGRSTKVISFKYGEDPTGFIGKHQALPRRSRTAEQIAKEIDSLLEADTRTAPRLQEARDHGVPF